MTRCLEFYDKLERDGNFCNLSPTSVSQIKAYNEMRAAIGKHIPDRQFIVDSFPEGAARAITTYARDEKSRTDALNYVVACLKRKEKVTAGDLKSTIQAWHKAASGSCGVGSGSRSKNFANAKSVTPQADVKSKITDEQEQPENPVAQIDQDTVRKQEIAAAAKNQPVFTKASEPAPYVLPDLTPPCKSGKPCPGEKSYLLKQPTLGNKCMASGSLVANERACPILRRQAEADPAYQRAIATARLEMAKPIRGPGVKIVKTPLTCEELSRCADDLIERSGFFTEREVGLVDEIVRAHYENIHTRADFLKKAANWFLTKAEEES